MLLVKRIGDENQVADWVKIVIKLFFFRNLEKLEVLEGAVS